MKNPDLKFDPIKIKKSLMHIVGFLSSKRVAGKSRMIWFILFIIFIIIETIIFNNWVLSFKKKQIIQLTIPTTPVVPVARPSVSTQPDSQIQQPVITLAQKVSRMRDPFLTSMSETEQLSTAGGNYFSGVSLTGILWDPKEPTAIIDGQVYKIGDVIDGKTITKITNDKVILEADGIEYLLMMWK